jgi:MazG family protein
VEEPNVYFINRQCTFSKYKLVCVHQLALDLHFPLPSPADYIDNVTIFREQVRVGFRVMCIPGILLPVLQITNLSFILVVFGPNAGWKKQVAVESNRSQSSSSLLLRTAIKSSARLKEGMSTGEKFERAVAIMARLRAPGGCPWDREQTFDSIKPYTLEEAYEVLEAIDNRDWDELKAELGDLLLQVLFYAEMAQEERRFSIDDVLEWLSRKLVDRHPHVFGDVKAETSADVLRNWEALKAEEKKKRLEAGGGKAAEEDAKPESVLAGVSAAVPALLEAYKLSSRAAHVGFDWPNVEGLFEKLSEETEELKQEIERLPAPPRPAQRGIAGSHTGAVVPTEELKARLEDEIGDMLFVLVNISRYLSLDPESALKKANRKFKRRFQWLEQEIRASGRRLEDASLDEMEAFWRQSKAQESK